MSWTWVDAAVYAITLAFLAFWMWLNARYRQRVTIQRGTMKLSASSVSDLRVLMFEVLRAEGGGK